MAMTMRSSVYWRLVSGNHELAVGLLADAIGFVELLSEPAIETTNGHAIHQPFPTLTNRTAT